MPSVQELPPSASRSRRLYILDCALSTPNFSGGRIISSSTSGTDEHNVISNMSTLPDGITIDHASGHMYWTHMGSALSTNSGSISRANLDGSDRHVVVEQGNVGVWTPKQISFVQDAGSKWIYWCDREGMKVMRACVDTLPAQPQVLVDAGDAAKGDGEDKRNWCVGIAVDAPRGDVYWSQKGLSKGFEGRIFRAKIDNAEASKELLLDRLPEPIDLELDEERRVLYWTDRGDPPRGNSLNSASVGGTEVGEVQVLATRFHEAIGLALDKEERKAYVSDLAGGVYEVDLASRKKKVLFPELGDLTGIALV
ncbi:3-hydroxyacyl-CoA dehydrogenase [Ascochyta rabiei]|uniref:3-hydroxyacyl-CoA dehydrogenase n=1 Tax=Didymella rabiei TaxID=5454 RepID=A0A163D4E4_DIDRA|nr:3-hydroxyacyl-CoA dehydrogenase [Ascochyta rabiei]KZM22902.1 3-hydroxyacyl-CoA dehydrogenase [Ascochyta rabiei]UPX10620.1 3-hydroxyacyl-CoA dehydrogenase [Ascochyta rabiei]